MPKPRKPIADLIEELRSWLPNYDHGPNDFPTVFYRILANAPGAEELEDIGYEPIGNMGWRELDLLGRVLGAIQDKRDVEDLVQGLIRDEEGEVEESRKRKPANKTVWTRQNTKLDTWFERDRAHVSLETLNGKTIIEWWDEAVEEAVQDGFLNPKDYHGSAVEYANYIGAQPGKAAHEARRRPAAVLPAGAPFPAASR